MDGEACVLLELMCTVLLNDFAMLCLSLAQQFPAYSTIV